MAKQTIYIDGFISKDIPDTVPDFILGKGSLKVDELIAFLTKYKPLAVNGFLNYEIKKGQSGKRYASLDTWAFEQQPQQVREDALIKLKDPSYPTPTEQGIDLKEMERLLSMPVEPVTADHLDIDPRDIPF